MVEFQTSNLAMRVQFPLSAPILKIQFYIDSSGLFVSRPYWIGGDDSQDGNPDEYAPLVELADTLGLGPSALCV